MEAETNLEIKGDDILAVLDVDNIIALYSHSDSNKLFYLCKVVSFGVAMSNMVDKYDHHIKKRLKVYKMQLF